MNLIFGCGYLGQRVAALWLKQGKQVAALTRGFGEQLQQAGISPIVGDILKPETLKQLPEVDTILYAVGMDRSSGKSFREVYVDGLRNVLTAIHKPKRFIYVSSTSVYGQSDGEWVDETSPTEPVTDNGKVVLEAEELLRLMVPEAIILRFAGIYGPGRLIRQALIVKGEPVEGEPDRWLNLIHVDDGARAVLAAEERAGLGETYLVCDDHPVLRRDFYTHMANQLNAPSPTFEQAGRLLHEPPIAAVRGAGGSPALASRDGSHRRISNRKMREQLQVELRYPSYREGILVSRDAESS